jgi:hypothetical protein
MHGHEAGWHGDGSCDLLAGLVDKEHGTRIPLTSVGDALVLGCPTRQGSPHPGAPGVVALNDQHCGRPARLILESVEDLTEDVIGAIERVKVRTAGSKTLGLAIPDRRRVRCGQVQVEDVSLAGSSGSDGVLFKIDDGTCVIPGVPDGEVGRGGAGRDDLLDEDAQRKDDVLSQGGLRRGGAAILRVFIVPIAVGDERCEGGAVGKVPTDDAGGEAALMGHSEERGPGVEGMSVGIAGVSDGEAIVAGKAEVGDDLTGLQTEYDLDGTRCNGCDLTEECALAA